MKRNINTGGGDYRDIHNEGTYIEGDYYALQPERSRNEKLLIEQVKSEVFARLRQSLHNEVRIELGKTLQPEQVRRPWESDIKIGSALPIPLSNDTSTIQVFDRDDVQGKLLILGKPGSGKTTTQLELAKELLKRTSEQAEYPIPVLFNLTSWKGEQFDVWLVIELNIKYGVRKDIAKNFLSERRLLLLLDGLDELVIERQEQCVQAINQCLNHDYRPLYLVVCSRDDEYQRLSNQLGLNAAIYLKELTNKQIYTYLLESEREALCQVLRQEKKLLELVRSPFFLSIITLAYQEIEFIKWQELQSSEERVQYLLDAYIFRMLERQVSNRSFARRQVPSSQQIRLWLIWLAQQMQANRKSEFLIEEMQPSLLQKSKHLKRYKVWVRVNVALFAGFLISSWSSLQLSVQYLTLELLDNFLKTGINPLEFQAKILLQLLILLIISYVIHLLVNTVLMGFFLSFVIGLGRIKSALIFGFMFGISGGLGFFYLVKEPVMAKLFIESEMSIVVDNVGLFSLAVGLLNAIPGSGIGFFIGGLIKDFNIIEITEVLTWSFRRARNILLSGILIGSIVLPITILVMYSLFNIFPNPSFDISEYSLFKLGTINFFIILSIFVAVGFFMGLLLSLPLTVFGLVPKEIDSKAIPNQGIVRSAQNFFYFVFLCCLAFTFYGMISSVLVEVLKLSNGVTGGIEARLEYILGKVLQKSLNIGLGWGTIIGTFGGMRRGGAALVQHLTLRWCLFKQGFIPWNLTRFLDYCTERLFIQRVGGRYRFIHKLLQDHFAAMPFDKH